MHGAQVKHLPRRFLGAFFLADGIAKIVQPSPLDDVIAHLGFSPVVVVVIGVILIIATMLYLIPRTAVIGAVLMTAYFGGALAAHARVGDPAITYIAVFALAVGVWGALYVVDARVRSLLQM